MKAFTLATCVAISWATCIEECVQLSKNVAVHATQCNRTHPDTSAHSVMSPLHVLNIDDTGDTQTLSPHVSECLLAHYKHMPVDKSLILMRKHYYWLKKGNSFGTFKRNPCGDFNHFKVSVHRGSSLIFRFGGVITEKENLFSKVNAICCYITYV